VLGKKINLQIENSLPKALTAEEGDPPRRTSWHDDPHGFLARTKNKYTF
jgi:hypothetical protein